MHSTGMGPWRCDPAFSYLCGFEEDGSYVWVLASKFKQHATVDQVEAVEDGVYKLAAQQDLDVDTCALFMVRSHWCCVAQDVDRALPSQALLLHTCRRGARRTIISTCMAFCMCQAQTPSLA